MGCIRTLYTRIIKIYNFLKSIRVIISLDNFKFSFRRSFDPTYNSKKVEQGTLLVLLSIFFYSVYFKDFNFKNTKIFLNIFSHFLSLYDFLTDINLGLRIQEHIFTTLMNRFICWMGNMDLLFPPRVHFSFYFYGACYCYVKKINFI
ncbi:hypothetical protein PUN28_020821 [Cardiocondyla obscurior]|uniref:Uncharacterized protein n=1 Tax=Cardiocondyla obscurior TaxID=286306 RepID=A0AAW2E648_9HYME